jgi:hypothetical protein
VRILLAGVKRLSTRATPKLLAAIAGALLCACTAQPTPPSAPTVAAVATQVRAIESGAATPGSTAQAVATHVAPTLQAVQQTVGPIATMVAQSPVHITSVDVTGDDTMVVLQNVSGSQVNLNGWSLLLGPNIDLTLPPVMLAPGQSRTLHVSAGTTTDSDVYLNTPSPGGVSITFAPGQRAVLIAPDEQIASIFANS